MKPKTILTFCCLLILSAFIGCSSTKKESQPPTEVDQQRIEKDYQQSVDKLHDLTSGTKDTLDGKAAPDTKKKAQHSPEK